MEKFGYIVDGLDKILSMKNLKVCNYMYGKLYLVPGVYIISLIVDESQRCVGSTCYERDGVYTPKQSIPPRSICKGLQSTFHKERNGSECPFEDQDLLEIIQ